MMQVGVMRDSYTAAVDAGNGPAAHQKRAPLARGPCCRLVVARQSAPKL